ncbi:hypothetical protein HF086_007849 [Spodoptera exigua]|uniref:Uncharacterized protein n=1 Tax=Spodoptera exigua TaxID=7107 RepID=A0A922M2A8_SPOEX|nr:hypothetical protein HF086_007849 [Spodoptera exigua]
MSGEPEVTRTPEEEEEEEIKSSYKPPPEKTIDEILAADQEDESLRKYKEALLGEAQAGAVIVGPKQVDDHEVQALLIPSDPWVVLRQAKATLARTAQHHTSRLIPLAPRRTNRTTTHVAHYG